MKKISNPFVNFNGYDCFGCSPVNIYGLKMEFFENDDEIISFWKPSEYYQGWNNVLHGGIQSTLIDEIASWFVFVKLKAFGVTSELSVKLKKPVIIKEGQITLHAALSEMKRNIAIIKVSLYDCDNVLCAEGNISIFTFSKDKKIGEIFYPGYDKFVQS